MAMVTSRSDVKKRECMYYSRNTVGLLLLLSTILKKGEAETLFENRLCQQYHQVKIFQKFKYFRISIASGVLYSCI